MQVDGTPERQAAKQVVAIYSQPDIAAAMLRVPVVELSLQVL